MTSRVKGGHRVVGSELDAADDQIGIGKLNEEGLMDMDWHRIREGRSDKPEVFTQLLFPKKPDPNKDYSAQVGYDPVMHIRKQAEAARAVTLINGALELIYEDLPELPLIDAIGSFLKSADLEKAEMEKTNIPFSPAPEDSVAELSPEEQEDKAD